MTVLPSARMTKAGADAVGEDGGRGLRVRRHDVTHASSSSGDEGYEGVTGWIPQKELLVVYGWRTRCCFRDSLRGRQEQGELKAKAGAHPGWSQYFPVFNFAVGVLALGPV
ncbi:hypothetical protein Pelo_17727 [Pelomyxa schiedti]|nr:hypothetical protein Pelo_17727 [Pelomyxa schiedti]